MTQELTASALTELLADVGKNAEDYERGDKSTESKEKLVAAAIEWVYDQTCATALAEFERCAARYTGRPISADGEES